MQKIVLELIMEDCGLLNKFKTLPFWGKSLEIKTVMILQATEKCMPAKGKSELYILLLTICC